MLRPRLPRLALAVTFGVLALGSALALAGVSAWLIARAWQMPPILDLSVAVVAVRALGISRGVLGYCERLASHDTALRAAGTARARLYRRLADGPAETVMRLPQGDIASRVGASVDELSDVLVRAVLPDRRRHGAVDGVGRSSSPSSHRPPPPCSLGCLLVAGRRRPLAGRTRALPPPNRLPHGIIRVATPRRCWRSNTLPSSGWPVASTT